MIQSGDVLNHRSVLMLIRCLCHLLLTKKERMKLSNQDKNLDKSASIRS